MSEVTVVAEADSTSGGPAPSAEPPTLQDAAASLPVDVAAIEPEAAAEAPSSPDPQSWCHNLAPNFACACLSCGISYDTQWVLKRHVDSQHPQSSHFAYICTHCNRGYDKFYRLARHVAAVAAGEAEHRGGTATDEMRWPGRTNIISRLNLILRRGPARRQPSVPK